MQLWQGGGKWAAALANLRPRLSNTTSPSDPMRPCETDSQCQKHTNTSWHVSRAAKFEESSRRRLDEEQRKSADRAHRLPAPGGRDQGFPAASDFDATLSRQKNGPGEGDLLPVCKLQRCSGVHAHHDSRMSAIMKSSWRVSLHVWFGRVHVVLHASSCPRGVSQLNGYHSSSWTSCSWLVFRL